MKEIELVQKEMCVLDDKIWQKYYSNKRDNAAGRNPNVAHVYLKNAIICVLMDENHNTENVLEEITAVINESEYAEEILSEYILLEEIKTEVFIRKDFRTALESVENGRELSYALGYGFSKKDIVKLANLHKEGKCREKIEDLLEDCNFHYECSKFANGEYDEFLA